jgi:hypothetical protein
VPSGTTDPALRTRLHEHFAQHTRAVLDVPHDGALVVDSPIDYDAPTPDAWLRVTAVADGL